MRHRHWLAQDHVPATVHHCVSRIVDRQFLFGDAEKDLFRSLMLELARSFQVRILTFCIMADHFHLLVEVPRARDPLPGVVAPRDAASHLTGCQQFPAIRHALECLRRSGDPTAQAAWLASFNARRCNLPSFVKLLKQRFSSAYNRRRGRRGTLWQERFRSVLVEGGGHALVAMAAYIDLNPVRAGLVRDPKDYRWSGYGEAVAGGTDALAGIHRIVDALATEEIAVQAKALATYGNTLYGEGTGNRGTTGDPGGSPRGTPTREELLAALANKEQLALADYLRCRVRYFSDGAVLGCREFVDAIFEKNRDRFGPRRRTGARPLQGLKDGGLFTMRGLRLGVFG